MWQPCQVWPWWTSIKYSTRCRKRQGLCEIHCKQLRIMISRTRGRRCIYSGCFTFLHHKTSACANNFLHYKILIQITSLPAYKWETSHGFCMTDTPPPPKKNKHLQLHGVKACISQCPNKKTVIENEQTTGNNLLGCSGFSPQGLTGAWTHKQQPVLWGCKDAATAHSTLSTRQIVRLHATAEWPPHTHTLVRSHMPLGFTVLPHSPYLHNLASLDYAFFEMMKDTIRN